VAAKRKGIERARRDGQITLSKEDRAAVDAQLRAIDADPERLAPWEDVKARLGLPGERQAVACPPGPLPRWRENYEAIIRELLEAAANPRRRRSWRARYGALVAEARSAEKLKGSARTEAMVSVCQRIDEVEGANLLAGFRFDAACAMELAISRALPGRYAGTCPCCYLEKALADRAAVDAQLRALDEHKRKLGLAARGRGP
jgi:hypothetical protein